MSSSGDDRSLALSPAMTSAVRCGHILIKVRGSTMSYSNLYFHPLFTCLGSIAPLVFRRNV